MDAKSGGALFRGISEPVQVYGHAADVATRTVLVITMLPDATFRARISVDITGSGLDVLELTEGDVRRRKRHRNKSRVTILGISKSALLQVVRCICGRALIMCCKNCTE